MNVQLQPFRREGNGQGEQDQLGDHRDARGRFTYGHPGGPGRPPRVVEGHYLRALARACPPERFALIIERLIKAAEEGDTSALQLVFRYLIGTPSVAAPTLTALAIAEAADADPVEREAKKLKFQVFSESYLDAIDR